MVDTLDIVAMATSIDAQMDINEISTILSVILLIGAARTFPVKFKNDNRTINSVKIFTDIRPGIRQLTGQQGF